MFKLKRDLVPLSVIICLLATLCFVFAQETLTITTYYPSPYGSYQDLETGNLTFRYSTSTDGLVHFNNATTYDRRLRITAGFNDTWNNDQGASIDLHGNAHATYPGRLDLVAGQGGNVTFWSSPTATSAIERMRITNTGNVGIGNWTGTTGPTSLFHVATSTTDIGVSTFEQASTDTDAYDLNFRKAHGTVAAPTVITTGDALGVINFNGYAGATGYRTGAIIQAASEGTVTIAKVPAYLAFWTKPDSASSIAERMRISSSGNVGIGTTAPLERLEVSGGTRFSLTPTAYTTLSAAMSNVQTTATVGSTVGYPTAGTLLIDSEAMTYTGTTTTSFTGLTRGVLGTAAAAHLAGATVKNYLFIALATATTTPRMVITGDGYVGIGTATPTASLQVDGSIYTAPWTDVNFNWPWSNRGAGCQNVQYKKVGDLVFLRGTATSGANLWINCRTIFNLPVGYRPAALIWFCQMSYYYRPVVIDINTSGDVKYPDDGESYSDYGRGQGSGSISLDGIVFSVD